MPGYSSRILPALESGLSFFRPHHQELRRRLCIILGGMVVCSAIAYRFAEPLAILCITPLQNASPLVGKLVYTSLPEAFIAYLKIAVLAGIIGSMPLTLYQIWAFIAPGLHRQEKRTALTIAFWASLLFAAGAGFSFFVALPQLLKYFMGYVSSGLVPLPKFGAYLHFVAKMTIGVGLAFEIPFLMVMAKKVGLIKRDYFKKKRIWFYGIIIAGAFFLSTGDMAATALLSLPLFLFYETGNVISRRIA
ncbi:MAG: twin-arginine translocase subunit TatC [Acidobacteria bacterium]|nr:MAG: twin-arginine translocase subunit TatC [Acidobacteriota bacterium]